MSNAEPKTPSPRKPDRIVPVSIALIALLAAGTAVWWEFASHQRSKSREACHENLHRIALALRAYHEQYSSFPPAYVTDSKQHKVHSWRVLLLPFLGLKELYDQYDFTEPWDGPHNSLLINRMPDVYACPAVRGVRPGVTNYLAVVGRATAWPEQYSARLDDFHDGASESILLVESRNRGQVWISPEDLTATDASYRIGPSSAHEDAGEFLVAMADGTTRLIGKEVTRDNIRSLLSIDGGRPLAGGDWPQPPAPEIAELPPARPSTEFKATDVLPHPTDPIKAERNSVYCPTFVIAWDEMRQFLGLKSLRLEGDPPLAAALNQFEFNRQNLSDAAYVARSGRGDETFRESLREELGRKFPNSRPQLIDSDQQDHELQVFAFLSKSLPFATEFDKLSDPLEFRTAGGTAVVKAFGAPHPRPIDSRSELMESQVAILDYVSDDDFIIRLAPVDSKDEILLAKLSPGDTLLKTIEVVQRRIRTPDPMHTDHHFLPTESLAVPMLTACISRSFPEITQRTIEGTDLHISQALQVIQFQLNESGARLESEALILGDNGHIPQYPAGKRSFRLDRPFLLYLNEVGADQPYFAMWIGNSELMQSGRW